MAKKNFLITDKQIENDIVEFCKINNIEDVDKFKNDCFKTGFNIKKYGLLGEDSAKIVEVEVIKEKIVEVPVEVIKYIEKPIEVIKEVEKIVEKPVEVIKEVIVPKIEYVKDESSNNELLTKIEQLEKDKQLFSTKIEEMEKIFQNTDKTKQLTETLFNLKTQLDQKNKRIKELEDKINELGDALNTKFATFHPNSNLKNKL